MNMQMPVMDGIAATRAIRSGGGPNAAVPIIALSADAAPERRRFYENVGLTSFMTKPISIEALRRALAPIALGAVTPASAQEEAVIQPDRLAELRLVLGPQKYFMLLRLLTNELLERPGDMFRSMIAGDLPAVRAQAHSRKGAAGNLGAAAVERAATAVELALPGPELELALRRLEVEAASAHRALVEIIAADPSAERKSA
jgi:CheY-like chemotaxis protein